MEVAGPSPGSTTASRSGALVREDCDLDDCDLDECAHGLIEAVVSPIESMAGRLHTGLALSGFQARVLLVDHEHPAAPVHDLCAGELLECLERIAYLHDHFFLIENKYQLE